MSADYESEPCFVKATTTTELYTNLNTLSLHDALPILVGMGRCRYLKSEKAVVELWDLNCTTRLYLICIGIQSTRMQATMQSTNSALFFKLHHFFFSYTYMTYGR